MRGDTIQRPRHGSRPRATTRDYHARPRTSVRPRPNYQTRDRRYHRPNPRYVRSSRYARSRVPNRGFYRPYYTRWYQHPYYRHAYSTSVVVGFGFGCDPWLDTWAPPRRVGWRWMPGTWTAWGYWSPGFWAPQRSVRVPVGYAFVPGWWDNNVYIEGYYRTQNRNGWAWNDGYYLDDGTYVRGHWRPQGNGPDGYDWEAGFWDGENWVEGFWRPQFRTGFTWVSAYYDDDSIFHAGYWMPVQQQPGSIWVPGWFDGNEWQQGYWENEQTYGAANVQEWTPEDGWNDGWEAGEGWGAGEVIENRTPESPEQPIAMPVWFDEDDLEDAPEANTPVF